MVDLIISLAEILIIISYLFRDILLLRIVTTFGLIGYVIAGFIAGYNEAGMKALIILNAAGVLVNIYQIYQIFLERAPILLPDNLKELYKECFHKLVPADFLKLHKMAISKTTPAKFFLIEQDKLLNELMLITKGHVNIVINGQTVTKLGQYFYIGEMCYLSGKPATATVIAADEVEVLVWSKKILDKLERDDPKLHSKFYQSIANNLITKIHLSKNKLTW